MDWAGLFHFGMNPLELMLRGTLMYWLIYLLFRYVLRANLRREMLTLDDLHAKLREQGVEDVRQVKAAFMESDGMISVVRRDGARPQAAPEVQRQRRAG